MPHVQSINRNQLQLVSLEELISPDNIVRLIDLYGEAINAKELGFTIKGESEKGRRAYQSKDLIKLYMYGYMHSVRSTRKLEKACKTNIEIWWLLNNNLIQLIENNDIAVNPNVIHKMKLRLLQ